VVSATDPHGCILGFLLGTNNTANLVINWNVSDKPSLSDYRYICFQIGNITINQVTFRDPRRINWESYRDNLKVNLETILQRICVIRDKDQSVDQLQQAYWHIITTVQPRPLAHQGWLLGGIKR
jgi:hypothetical protein